MTDNTQKKLFTDTLPQDVAGIVRGIAAAKDVESISSAPSSFDADGKGQWLQWVSAWKIPDTNKWTIEKHRKFTDAGQDSSLQKKTVMRGACFFDALYYCGYDEISNKGMGAHLDRSAIPEGKIHYTEAAAKTNQPLDISGIPHPAAYGEILTDGNFDQAAYDTAARTKDIELVQMPSRSENYSLIPMDQLNVGEVNGATIDLRRALAGKADLKAMFVRANNAIDKAGDDLNPYKVKDYVHEFLKNHSFSLKGHDDSMMAEEDKKITNVLRIGFTVCLGGMAAVFNPVTIPLALGSGYLFSTGVNMAPLTWNSAVSKIKNATSLNRAKRAVRALPDPGTREQGEHVLNQIRASHHFMKAAQIVECNSSSSNFHMRRAFRQVAKGARLAGMSEIECNKLQQALLEGEFPSTHTLRSRVSDLREAFSNRISSIAHQIVQADSVEQITYEQSGNEGHGEKIYEP